LPLVRSGISLELLHFSTETVCLAPRAVTPPLAPVERCKVLSLRLGGLALRFKVAPSWFCNSDPFVFLVSGERQSTRQLSLSFVNVTVNNVRAANLSARLMDNANGRDFLVV
jgi:hypothetical protein